AHHSSLLLLLVTLVEYAIRTRDNRLLSHLLLSLFFFFHDTATTELYTLSLHDALPIFDVGDAAPRDARRPQGGLRLAHPAQYRRSEEHTSELQSRENLVCRLLLEKKKRRADRDESGEKQWRRRRPARS